MTFELKTFTTMSIHMTCICAKFHWNSSTNYREIASRKIGVNGRPAGRTTAKLNASARPPHYWQSRKIW